MNLRLAFIKDRRKNPLVRDYSYEQEENTKPLLKSENLKSLTYLSTT